MKQKRKFCSLSLALLLMSTSTLPTLARSIPIVLQVGVSKESLKDVPQKVKKALDKGTTYLVQKVAKPKFGSIGGEWAVFGLARHGAKVPKDYYEKYYKQIEQVAKIEHEKKTRGWKDKVTETQRLAIAVAAIGKDPTKVNGVNLIDYSYNKGKNMSSLSKAHQVLGARQGLNELVFGLITMNLKDIKEPYKAETTKKQVINKILKEYKTPDGGFSLAAKGYSGEIDITAMTIQALAPYYKQKGYEEVTKAINEGLEFLASRQNQQGGFGDGLSTGVKGNCESTAQVIVALCSLGIDPTKDTRFIKKGSTLIDELLSYQLADGGFEHIKGQGVNQMATEQGYYGLVAYERLVLGRSPIYDMREME